MVRFVTQCSGTQPKGYVGSNKNEKSRSFAANICLSDLRFSAIETMKEI